MFMWLSVGLDISPTTHDYISPTMFCSYPVNDTYAKLSEEVLNECWYTKKNTHRAGVLADWLEDHRYELLAGASNPTKYDAAEMLDALIRKLRSLFALQTA